MSRKYKFRGREGIVAINKAKKYIRSITGALREATESEVENGLDSDLVFSGSKSDLRKGEMQEKNISVLSDQLLDLTDSITTETTRAEKAEADLASSIDSTSSFSSRDLIALQADIDSKFANTGGVLKGDIIPDADNTYSLGSAQNRWKDVYIGPGSLYIGDQKVLESIQDTIVITADINQNISMRAKGTGDLELTTDTGAIQIKSDVLITPGKGFNTLDSSKVVFHSGIAVAGETITDVATPTNDTDAANKLYVDSVQAALDLTVSDADLAALEVKITENLSDVLATSQVASETAIANEAAITSITALMHTDEEALAAKGAHLKELNDLLDTESDTVLTNLAKKLDKDLGNLTSADKADLALKYEELNDLQKQELVGHFDVHFDNLSYTQKDTLKLKFEHLTEAEITTLRGTFYHRNFDDLTLEQLDRLKIQYGDLTPEQRAAITLRFSELTEAEKEELKFKSEHFTDVEWENFKPDFADMTAAQRAAVTFKFSELTKTERDGLTFTREDFTAEEWDSFKMNYSELSVDEIANLRGEFYAQNWAELSDAQKSELKVPYADLSDADRRLIALRFSDLTVPEKNEMLMKFNELNAEEIEQLRGATGAQGDIGPKGPEGNAGSGGAPGRAMVYADLTAQEIAYLTGPPGDNGADLSYKDLTPAQKEELILTWEKLTDVQKQSLKFTRDNFTAEEWDSFKLKFEDLSNAEIAVLTPAEGVPGRAFVYEDFDALQLANLKGETGDTLTWALMEPKDQSDVIAKIQKDIPKLTFDQYTPEELYSLMPHIAPNQAQAGEGQHLVLKPGVIVGPILDTFTTTITDEAGVETTHEYQMRRKDADGVELAFVTAEGLYPQWETQPDVIEMPDVNFSEEGHVLELGAGKVPQWSTMQPTIDKRIDAYDLEKDPEIDTKISTEIAQYDSTVDEKLSAALSAYTPSAEGSVDLAVAAEAEAVEAAAEATIALATASTAEELLAAEVAADAAEAAAAAAAEAAAVVYELEQLAIAAAEAAEAAASTSTSTSAQTIEKEMLGNETYEIPLDTPWNAASHVGVQQFVPGAGIQDVSWSIEAVDDKWDLQGTQISTAGQLTLAGIESGAYVISSFESRYIWMCLMSDGKLRATQKSRSSYRASGLAYPPSTRESSSYGQGGTRCSDQATTYLGTCSFADGAILPKIKQFYHGTDGYYGYEGAFTLALTEDGDMYVIGRVNTGNIPMSSMDYQASDEWGYSYYPRGSSVFKDYTNWSKVMPITPDGSEKVDKFHLGSHGLYVTTKTGKYYSQSMNEMWGLHMSDAPRIGYEFDWSRTGWVHCNLLEDGSVKDFYLQQKMYSSSESASVYAGSVILKDGTLLTAGHYFGNGLGADQAGLTENPTIPYEGSSVIQVLHYKQGIKVLMSDGRMLIRGYYEIDGTGTSSSSNYYEGRDWVLTTSIPDDLWRGLGFASAPVINEILWEGKQMCKSTNLDYSAYFRDTKGKVWGYSGQAYNDYAFMNGKGLKWQYLEMDDVVSFSAGTGDRSYTNDSYTAVMGDGSVRISKLRQNEVWPGITGNNQTYGNDYSYTKLQDPITTWNFDTPAAVTAGATATVTSAGAIDTSTWASVSGINISASISNDSYASLGARISWDGGVTFGEPNSYDYWNSADLTKLDQPGDSLVIQLILKSEAEDYTPRVDKVTVSGTKKGVYAQTVVSPTTILVHGKSGDPDTLMIQPAESFVGANMELYRITIM